MLADEVNPTGEPKAGVKEEPKVESTEKPKIENKRVFILGVVLTLFTNLVLLVAWYMFSSYSKKIPNVPIVKQTVN